MANKKIILVMQEFPFNSSFLLKQFESLYERNQEVQLVALSSQKKKGNYKFKKNLHSAWPSSPRLWTMFLVPFLFLKCLIMNTKGTITYFGKGISMLGLTIFKQFYLDAVIVSLKPALLHFEFGTLARDRMHLKDLLGCQIIVSFRGYDLNYVGLDKPKYYEMVWRKSDALHFLGKDLQKRALKRGCPPDKFYVLIPPAVDATFFNPQRGLNAQTKVQFGLKPLKLLSVGRLAWKKGYEYALEAVRLLIDEGIDCDYSIIGSGEYLRAIAFARHQFGLEEKVHLLGSMAVEEIREVMDEADIFLHPAVSEGFCNAVIEAQAMELPVVCTDADGLSENIEDGVTGFVVPRRDPKAMAKKVAQLANDITLRNQMGKRGRERVLKYFQIEQQIDAFENLYEKVLSQSES